MTIYVVNVPITGVITVEVEAASEDEALEKFWGSSELTLENLQEWEAHDHITEGNVFHGVQNDVEVIDSYEKEQA